MKAIESKKFFTAICKILGLFTNTLTVRDKYSLLNKDKLPKPIQNKLYPTKKTFSQYFSSILKSRLTFQHFQKKDDRHSCCVSEITDSEIRG